MRRNPSIEFPITLGRDFCGEIVNKGMGVRSDLQIGQKVWGVISPHQQGCHSEYAIADANNVRTQKPI